MASGGRRYRLAGYLGPAGLLLALGYLIPGSLTSPPSWTFLTIFVFLIVTGFALRISIKAPDYLAEVIIALTLQAAGLICFFALVFRDSGLLHNGSMVHPSFHTALYFSVVTWTTLGYGDFQPPDSLQMVAACEALLGYLYLGIIVGLLSRIFR